MLLQSPAYHSSDSGRLLYFSRVICFYHYRFFRLPLAKCRETLSHDAVCSEIFYVLYGDFPVRTWKISRV